MNYDFDDQKDYDNNPSKMIEEKNVEVLEPISDNPDTRNHRNNTIFECQQEYYHK